MARKREVHNIRAYLVNMLNLIKRDPGIEVAADATATAFVAGQGTAQGRLGTARSTSPAQGLSAVAGEACQRTA